MNKREKNMTIEALQEIKKRLMRRAEQNFEDGQQWEDIGKETIEYMIDDYIEELKNESVLNNRRTYLIHYFRIYKKDDGSYCDGKDEVMGETISMYLNLMPDELEEIKMLVKEAGHIDFSVEDWTDRINKD